ncbi:MAG: DUF6259 domain-containing protein [Phycisphaerae bacterium]
MIMKKPNFRPPGNEFHGLAHKCRGITGFLFLLCGLPLFAENRQYLLENEALKITFAESSQGFDCLSIENKLAGNVRFIQPDPAGVKKWPGLWQMVFQKPTKDGKFETVTLSNEKCDGKKTANLIQGASGQKLVLQWREISLNEENDCLEVEATIGLDQGDAPSEWTIKINNRSKQWGLYSVSYPFLRTICTKGTAAVLIPGDEKENSAHGGKLYRNSTKSFAGVYPSGYCPFQFLAFNRGNSGLYIGAHDGDARTKKLIITDDQHVTFETLAENAGIPNSHSVTSFPVVIKAFNGDWWKAAGIYREWALQQKWARKGWLAERGDAARDFLNVGVWMQLPKQYEGFDTVCQDMANAKKIFAPLNVGVHLYCWHLTTYDKGYPEFFPARKGAPEVFNNLQANGHLVMPYINAHSWDTGLPSYNQARSYVAESQDRVVSTETFFDPKVKLAGMCPYTEFWQNKVNELCNRLVEEFNVKAIYLDQFGTTPHSCFNSTHQHPTGGGNYWVEGNRTMLEKITTATRPHKIALAGEFITENYIDSIDGACVGLMYRKSEDVPLFKAIYSGYASSFGCLESRNETLETFAMVQGRDFLWGVQPGWFNNWILDSEHRSQAEMLRELGMYRLAAKEFLVYGQLMDAVRFEKEPALLSRQVFGQWLSNEKTDSYSITMPSIMGTLWRNAVGDALGVVIMNLDSKPCRATFSIDTNRFLKSATGKLVISRLTLDGLRPDRTENSGKIEQEINLDPYEIMILTMR